MKDLLEIIPEQQKDAFEQAFEKQDHNDAVQMLSDLGYLAMEAFEDERITHEELSEAIDSFRKELKQAIEDEETSNLHDLYARSRLLPNDQKKGHLTVLELSILRDLVGLEGEFEMKKTPVQPDISYRIICYRFRVFDLVEALPDRQHFVEHLKKFQQVLKHYEFDKPLYQFANMLGDEEKVGHFFLTSAYINRQIFSTSIFFEVPEENVKKYKHIAGEKVKLTKEDDYLSGISPGKLKDSVRKILKEGSNKKRRDQISIYTNIPENQFLLRVLQVKLWIIGLYDGKLDRDFGQHTFWALKNLLELIAEKDEAKTSDLTKILHVVNKDQCALNLKFLIKKLQRSLKAEGDEAQGQSASSLYEVVLDEKYADGPDQAVRTEAKKLENALETELVSHAVSITDEKVKKRRKYQGKRGIRKLFSKLITFVEKVVGKIVSFLKKLFEVIKKSIKFIFDEIKEAIGTFRQGMSFLFGKRSIDVNPRIFSDFDFDFDGITVIDPAIKSDDIEQHSLAIKEKSEAIYPSLKFVVTVVKWGINLASGTAWIKILIGIAKLFKEFVISKIKDKQPVIGFG